MLKFDYFVIFTAIPIMLRWLHASDLQGDNAALFKQLRLTSIPANFILDENGKVLAKNLHGEELLQFVEAFYK